MKCVILQLNDTPQNGDTISGTINGVSVNGVWSNQGVGLKASNSSNRYDYVIQFYQGKYVFCSYEAMTSDTYVPTDLTINLFLIRESEPVRIPAKYLDTDNIENSISNINNNIKNIEIPPTPIISENKPTSSTKGVHGQSYYQATGYSNIQSSYIYSNNYGWLQECESRSFPKDPQINHTVTEEDNRSNITFYKDDNNIDLRRYRRMFIKIQSPDTLSSDDDSNIKIVVDTITISSKNDFLASQNKSWYCYINYVDKFAIATKDACSSSNEIDGVEAILAFPSAIQYSNNMFGNIDIENKEYNKKIPVGTNIKIWLR